jgi:hypothetical protein
MALLPEVHVSLDRPTIQHIYQLFLPFFPGGTLILGLALARPDSLAYFAASRGIGYYSLIVAAVFLAYVAGLMLYSLSLNFGAILSTILNQLCWTSTKCRPTRNNATTSQNHVWRTVAAAFLGKQLTPSSPAGLAGSGLFTSSNDFPHGVPASVQQYDLDWNDWYNVLQDYVLRGVPVLPSEVFFLFMIIQATGWALLIVSVPSRLGRQHPVALVVIALLVVFSALTQFGASYFYFKYDRLPAMELTARLLAEIREREDGRSSGSAAPPAGNAGN